jgi:hypothetical protein
VALIDCGQVWSGGEGCFSFLCSPHPGNIFIHEGGRMALIDCGQVWSGGEGYFSLLYSPHPGNIFIQEGGRVALIDCGQVWSGGGGLSFPLCPTLWTFKQGDKSHRRQPRHP